ncbi:MAG: hypothetical protein ACLP1D_09215 [Xanthobacteraceae bacterium]
MSETTIALIRVIHIGFGAFWLGSAMTLGFLLPMIKTRIGEQFAALVVARTWLLTVVTVAGGIAILAGLVLYGAIWAGVGFVGPAVWYANGGHAAILAFLLAAAIVEPAAHKLRALTTAQPPKVRKR